MLETELPGPRPTWWRRVRQRFADNHDMIYISLFAFLLLCSSITVSLVTVVLVQSGHSTRNIESSGGIPPAASDLVHVPVPTAKPSQPPPLPLLSVSDQRSITAEKSCKPFCKEPERDDSSNSESGELFFATLNESMSNARLDQRSPPALYLRLNRTITDSDYSDDADDGEDDDHNNNVSEKSTLVHINLSLLKRILQDNHRGKLPKVAVESQQRQNLKIERGYSINGSLDLELDNNMVDTEQQHETAEPDLRDYIMIVDPPLQPDQQPQQHVFDVMHRVWANYELNTFEADKSASLTIFWTFDASSVPSHTAYYAIVKHPSRDTFKFVDISRKLSRYQKTELIRNAIDDAMNEWSTSLGRLVVFREIPYRQVNLHKRVLIIGFRAQKHNDERTGEPDTFGDVSTNTIAHAAFNVLHLNNAYSYQLMPRPITAEIPLVLSYGPNTESNAQESNHLYLATQQDLAKIFNVSFAELYTRVRKPRLMTERINLAAVLIHELGHVLGLSHYLGTYRRTGFDSHMLDSYSIMAPVYNEKLTMLTALDKLAVNALFQTLRNEARAAQNQTL